VVNQVIKELVGVPGKNGILKTLRNDLSSGGAFIMGKSDDDSRYTRCVTKTVTVRSFYMDQKSQTAVPKVCGMGKDSTMRMRLAILAMNGLKPGDGKGKKEA
jgi:hypothetical protein